MIKSKYIKSKFQIQMNFVFLGLIIWYFMVVTLIFVLGFPSMGVQELFTIEENQIILGGVLQLLLFSLLWPLIYGFFYSVGWFFLGSGIVGTTSNLILLGALLISGLLSLTSSYILFRKINRSFL
ncbi:hypothetical protein CEE45_02110 [Candidatus Heimdallarchaeota archaeon B3_Heim]|nr:MAG: hypothetical protein CEE45_02110 [Candidatus Heimdallarchaeota archaeon B3_Heim]